MTVWTAYETEYDETGWTFHLLDVRCDCGWFLKDAKPLMGHWGVDAAVGVCKRHGRVRTDRFEVYDA